MEERVKRITICGACVYRAHPRYTTILLVRPHKDADEWSIPKGRRIGDESVQECVIREVKRETGFNITLEERLTVAYTHFSDERKKVYAFLARTMTGNFAGSPLMRSLENADVRWFSTDNLPQIYFYQLQIINEALKILKQRTYDDVPEEVLSVLQEIFLYKKDVDSWIVLKKELLKHLRPGLRTLFSTRDPYTKVQRINAFERKLMEAWSEHSGHELIFIGDDRSKS